MGYWFEVIGRARREALGEMRWTGPLKVAQSIVPTLASGIVTGIATGQLSYGAIASLVALFAVALVWFIQRMIVIPALMHAEAGAQIAALTPTNQPQLKGGFTLVPDTPLAEAINFAATGSWGGEPAGGSDRYLVDLNRALEDFTTLASGGSIRVFYRGFKDAPHQTLEHTSWFAHRIDIMDLLTGEAILRRRKDGTNVETCNDLRVSRAQWDANWDYLRSTLN